MTADNNKIGSTPSETSLENHNSKSNIDNYYTRKSLLHIHHWYNSTRQTWFLAKLHQFLISKYLIM